MTQQTFSVRDENGNTQEVSGDPMSTTLQQLLQKSHRGGGQTPRWGDYRFRVSGGGKSSQFGESDLSRTLGDLGIGSDQTIEIVPAQTA